jgi:hypothetical protein
MNITPRIAFAGTATAVALSAASLPFAHIHPTVLDLIVALCGWGVVAFLKSPQFADAHFSVVWAVAVVLHIIGFSIPAAAVWLGLRNRNARLCSALIGLWCLCYLVAVLVLLPAGMSP